jgi:hypothetical protein
MPPPPFPSPLQWWLRPQLSASAQTITRVHSLRIHRSPSPSSVASAAAEDPLPPPTQLDRTDPPDPAVPRRGRPRKVQCQFRVHIIFKGVVYLGGGWLVYFPLCTPHNHHPPAHTPFPVAFVRSHTLNHQPVQVPAAPSSLQPVPSTSSMAGAKTGRTTRSSSQPELVHRY